MLEVTINGVKEQVPQCTCGKCIVRRLRKPFWTDLPYTKDLGSTYNKDYPWKRPLKTKPPFYNRAVHTGYENSFKPSLPNGHISEMKSKYRPYSVDPNDYKKESKSTPCYSSPFIAGTTYDNFFPDWGSIAGEKPKPIPYSLLQIPLRGNSNYGENYIKHPDKFYKQRDPALFTAPTLKFFGDIKPETSYDTTYKPINLNQPLYFPKENDKNPYFTSNAFYHPTVPPDESTYKAHYKEYEDGMCKLRIYLNARGMKHLVI